MPSRFWFVQTFQYRMYDTIGISGVDTSLFSAILREVQHGEFAILVEYFFDLVRAAIKHGLGTFAGVSQLVQVEFIEMIESLANEV